jgi:WD40 repeat protein
MLLAFTLVTVAPLAVRAQEKKKEQGPVKVIDLKRTDPVSYEKEVEPIFYKKCLACHSGSVKEGNLDIASYEGLIKGGKRGTPIVPGKGNESLIIKLLSRTDHKPFMPPRGEDPIVSQEMALVKLWIDQGAKAPTGTKQRPVIVIGLPPPNVVPVRALAVSPDKAAVAAGRGNQIHVYDAGSGTHIRTLFAPNLKTADGKPAKAAHLSLVDSMAWSPDGKYLASGSFQEVAIWDPLTGEQRHKITGFAHNVVAIAFSPDGKLMGIAGGEPTVEGEVKVFEVGTWKLVTDIKNGHSDTVYGLAFSPEINVPVPKDAKELAEVKDPKDPKARFKFVPMHFLATGSADKFIKVWSLPDGKFFKSFEGHTHHVLDVGWMADGKLLASAGADNAVKVWDFDKGEQARTINAHTKQVTRLQFIGKKAEFITCGGDNQVKAFNATNGSGRNFNPAANDFVYAIGTSSDGTVVAAGGQDGIVRVYGANGQMTRTLLPPGAQPSPEKK